LFWLHLPVPRWLGPPFSRWISSHFSRCVSPHLLDLFRDVEAAFGRHSTAFVRKDVELEEPEPSSYRPNWEASQGRAHPSLLCRRPQGRHQSRLQKMPLGQRWLAERAMRPSDGIYRIGLYDALLLGLVFDLVLGIASTGTSRSARLIDRHLPHGFTDRFLFLPKLRRILNVTSPRG
jgi:hypothetical protein